MAKPKTSISPELSELLEAIRKRLNAGSGAPSIRELASTLQLSPTTVVKRMRELEQAGWIRRPPDRVRVIELV